jgi:Tfp pilus assembly protein PilN
MKLQLNLSTSALENKRPFLVGAGALGAIGLLILLGFGHAAYTSWHNNRELRIDIDKWQTQVRTLQAQQNELANYFQEPGSKEILDRAAFLNSQIDARSFPWSKIFMDLEPVLPAGVRVVSISPKMDNGRVSVDLTIGAGTDEQKLKFIEALEKSHAFSNIRLRDDRRSDQINTDKIQLILSAVYATT